MLMMAVLWRDDDFVGWIVPVQLSQMMSMMVSNDGNDADGDGGCGCGCAVGGCGGGGRTSPPSEPERRCWATRAHAGGTMPSPVRRASAQWPRRWLQLLWREGHRLRHSRL